MGRLSLRCRSGHQLPPECRSVIRGELTLHPSDRHQLGLFELVQTTRAREPGDAKTFPAGQCQLEVGRLLPPGKQPTDGSDLERLPR